MKIMLKTHTQSLKNDCSGLMIVYNSFENILAAISHFREFLIENGGENASTTDKKR